MMVSALHLRLDSFLILTRMKRYVFPLVLIAALNGLVISCTPYRQESGTPSRGPAPTPVTPPGSSPTPGLTTEPPAIAPTGSLVPPAPTPPSTPPVADYPYAEKTSTPGLVISPYAPYNVMDVKGLRSGQLALDPSCQKKFRVP